MNDRETIIHKESAIREITVSLDTNGERIDAYLARVSPDLSRSRIQRLLQEGQILLDGKPARPSGKVSSGQTIALVIPPPVESELTPQEMPLEIVYEDDDLLVINKPAGLVVHPAPGHPDLTLANALRARYPDLSIGGALRPGLVHRLDKDTSGLMVVAKNDAAMASLVSQMGESETGDRRMKKEYLALVWGSPPERGTIDAPIGRHPKDRKRQAVAPDGKPAQTDFETLQRFERTALVLARLRTGRTHQIRVHFSSLGYPIVGDPLYGGRAGSLGLDRQFLHAFRLGFLSPSSGEYIQFEASLPRELQAVLDSQRPRR